MTSPFIYDSDIPAAMLPEIKKLLEPWGWLIPNWCERVFVGYADDSEAASDGSVAECEVEYPYRWSRITFKPRFLNQTETARAHGLHEIAHIPVGLLSCWIAETIKTLLPEDKDAKLREFILEELRSRIEAVVQDLADRIAKHSESPIVLP